MSRYAFETLGVENLKPIKISLQLADESVKIPIGILVPSRSSGKFFFSTDFIVIDAEKDLYSSILLGRPFIVTEGQTLMLEVENFLLTLEKRILNLLPQNMIENLLIIFVVGLKLLIRLKRRRSMKMLRRNRRKRL
jgi:hypothetical protein